MALRGRRREVAVKTKRIAVMALAWCVATAAIAVARETAGKEGAAVAGNAPSATVIVERNASARGGADAWRKVKSLAATGRIESRTAQDREMPFSLEQKRPASTRFLITAQSQKSLRVFNGVEGWKVKPDSSGRPDLQPYSSEELRFARDSQVIDGPLMDDAARKGIITVLGMDVFEGRKNYVLGVKLPSGANHRVWVDAETFLESKFERDVQTSSGRVAVSTMVFRDYQRIEGLVMPMTIETGGDGSRSGDKLVIERVAINPELDDRLFERPPTPTHRRKTVTVDARAAGATPAAPTSPSATP